MPKKKYDDDDGRVIANMNVEGMPWYDENHRPSNQNEQSSRQIDPPSRWETFQIILGAMKAALLVVGVLSVGIILFVLFCTKVWFR